MKQRVVFRDARRQVGREVQKGRVSGDGVVCPCPVVLLLGIVVGFVLEQLDACRRGGG